MSGQDPTRGARAVSVLLGITALAAATSCGGGGASSTPRTAATDAVAKSFARFTITWPNVSAVTNARHRDYVSVSTKSVSIAVNGAVTSVDNPNIGSNVHTGTTTVVVPAPVGMDTFLVGDYDATGGSAGTGKLLAQNSVPFTVVAGANNNVYITLNGNLAQIVCAPVAPYVTNADGTFDVVGPAGQLTLEPEDADGNIIVAPGTLPALKLTPTNAADATTTESTTTPNLYTVNVMASPGVSVPITASGTSLAAKSITTACPFVRQQALYVVNHSNTANKPSIAVFAASASTAATPIATIVGVATDLVAPQFVAVDPKGNIFVSNQGPLPKTSFSQTAGYVTIYPAGSNGNATPIATIPNLDTPAGLGFDSKGSLYVLSIDRIGIYPSTADGVTNPAAASSTIAAPTPPPTAAPSPSASPVTNQTDLFSCYGLTLDASDNIYTACSNVINEFTAGSTGNAQALEIESVGTTAMSFSSHSWLAVATDSSGDIYAPASNNNLNFVEEFAPGSGANPAATPVPSAMSKYALYSQPLGIAVDANDAIYVGSYGANTVDVFASATTFTAGVPGATYSTGIDQPYGLYVR